MKRLFLAVTVSVMLLSLGLQCYYTVRFARGLWVG